MATFQTSYYNSIHWTYAEAVTALNNFINTLGAGVTLRYTDVIYLGRDRSKSAAVCIFDGIFIDGADHLHFADGGLELVEV